MQTTNAAFVFIKPHAVTDKTKSLVEATLAQNDITIISQGELTAEEIDEKKLIDQHYYAIASKATILKPSDLTVPNDKFEDHFGVSWQTALAGGRVFNAMDACAELGLDADGLDKIWAESKAAGKMVKLGGGFYCGMLQPEGAEACYVFNGFFMSMRGKFTAPGEKIHYYSVEFDSSKLSWADFRGKVLGPTDPADAASDSLRGMIMAQWEDLGLKSEPYVGENGVHASASPFEGLAERMNWLDMSAGDDTFGKALLEAGVDEQTINTWSVDPRVKMADGTTSSIFDALEDLDVKDCIANCIEIHTAAQ